MSTNQALVLARGLGTRMRSADPGAVLTEAQERAADGGMKAMMPIAGRPFLDYVLSSLADAGLTRVGIVVAPAHDALREYYGATAPPVRADVEFVVQPEARGTADAVLAAEAWSAGRPFVVVNGDNLYPVPVLAAMAALDEPGLPGFEAGDLIESGNIAAARIGTFALLQTDASGYLAHIVEKPGPGEAAKGRQVSMNCWRFDGRIFDACREAPMSARGEIELPSAVMRAVERGVRFRVVPASGPVLDLSMRADAAEVTRRLGGLTPSP